MRSDLEDKSARSRLHVAFGGVGQGVLSVTARGGSVAVAGGPCTRHHDVETPSSTVCLHLQRSKASRM